MFKNILLSLIIGISSTYAIDYCENPKTQIDMNKCAVQKYNKADKQLNIVYKKLKKLLDKTGKQKLKKAQLAWIKYRDAKAEFDADTMRGGSLAPLIYEESLRNTTLQRIETLKTEIKDRLEP